MSLRGLLLPLFRVGLTTLSRLPLCWLVNGPAERADFKTFSLSLQTQMD